MQGDCLEIMKQMPDKCVDLTVTSPPYDNLRDYKGYSFDFENTAKELYRITKDGGVVVWVVGDAVVNGSETGTSFKQALYFKEIGFNLHDTMIYQKDTIPFPERNRYNQSFEYMFVLSRGKPKAFNPLKEATKGYKPSPTSTTRGKDGKLETLKYRQGLEEKSLSNIWKFNVGYNKSTQDLIAFDHPAMFPEKLAQQHIVSWSSEGDIVFDPMNGSGTTTKCAKNLGRKFIGCDVSEEYCEIARKRLEQGTLF